MMKLKGILIATMAIGFITGLAVKRASAKEVTIRKVNSTQTKFSASFVGEAPEVSEVYTLDTDGECTAKVISVKGNSAIMGIGECDSKANLKPGAKLVTGTNDDDELEDSKSTRGSEAPRVRSQPRAKKMGDRFGVGVVYSMASKLKYNLSIGGVSASGEDATDPALGLGVFYHSFKPGKIGFSSALTYELEREVKSTTAAGSTFYYVNKPTISITTLSASANFSLENGAYFYLGANYPLINWKSDSAEIQGQLGYQLGGGYMIQREFGVDFQMRYLKAKGNYDGGLGSGSISEGKFDGFVLSAAYFFN